MTQPSLLFVASSLLSYSTALSESSSIAASVPSTFEQYCFPRSGGPFPADSIWPSVTLIYSGITLTTTPITVTMSDAIPTIAPVASFSSLDISGSENLNAAPGVPTSTFVASFRESSASFETASLSLASDQDASFPSSLASAVGQITSTTTSIMAFSSNSVTASPATIVGSGSSLATEPGMAVGRNTTDMSRNGWAASTQALSTALSGTGPGRSASGSSLAWTANNRGSMMTAISDASSFNSVPTQTARDKYSSLIEQEEETASAGLSLPTGQSSVPIFSDGNATIALSPPAVDALQLAQFMKNLGVSMFNASSLYVTRRTEDRNDAPMLAKLISDIAMQEKTQLNTLRDLLHRSGGRDVPACRYLLPSNTTELVSLLGALKSVELGVFMSLSESLPPSDTSASILLSSIASVAAKQNALLRTYINRNASIESFDTPSSDTWAYNVALEFVQPGSCPLELPLPILPMLTMNNKTAGYASPGANATFSWDVAGRSAASRSGKPLFVAWVNQVGLPVFTSLTTLGDGMGTTRVPLGLSGTAFAVLTAQPGLKTIDELTDATLAGPVVVSL